ncbi:Mediator of RNA polymerase II transcription subunit 5 [Wickerhamiella sorbophila]|uniref:Mediator of RNA polymerase II transcription subunit 5 n=1 Tax=Wickerhamiella sorbophila TaxID=45607 RepID=A0A2T0FHF9_9ASCO|nr:Mediator of RNA polymerase II transcription subunit 5 [Wickerhamiella sorbophila]PRT54379.1 Mediator of RNA polymerase II transcription subunit 5 [Wickerhamiella sorbophila]
MLQTLTETALARRWAPSLFSRLCSQLQDTCEVSQAELDWMLEAVVADNVPNVPLLEYILTVALDQKSVLPLETLLAQWASKSPENRSQSDKLLMIYISRGISQLRVTPDRVARLGEALDVILDQAISGSPESLFLLHKMGNNGVLRRIADLNYEWRLKCEAKVRNLAGPEIAGLFTFDTLEAATGEAVQVDTVSYTPSKTFRLLWLDTAVSRLEHLESSAFLQQLDILWPNERTPTLIYELTLTAFDGCAVAANSPESAVSFGLWTGLLLKRLPLVIQDLLARDSANPTADSALSRVLTTMDKKIIEIVDASDLRASFIRTCIDLGVCDSTVLHVLHKNHPARHEDPTVALEGTIKVDDIARNIIAQDFEKVSWETSIAVKLVHEYASHGPLRQKAIGSQFLKLFLKSSSISMRHHVALLCGALIVYPTACDHLFLHVPLRVVLDVLLAHLDNAANAAITQAAGYGDAGTILEFLQFTFARYQLDKQLLADPRNNMHYRSSWSQTFLLKTPGEYPTVSNLNDTQLKLLGLWIGGLFGGQGIGDAALQPYGEVLSILPALVGQVASALQLNVINQETLALSLEYFIQPGLTPLLAIIVDQLCHDLWLQHSPLGTLHIVSALLQVLQRENSRPAIKVVGAVVLPKISAALAWPAVSSHPDPAVAAVARNAKSLVSHLYPSPAEPKPLSGSLATNVSQTVSALQRWQERSVGLPTINRGVFKRAIPVLGPEETRKLIEKESKGGAASTEVEVALLVVYGSIEFGQSQNRDVLDAPGRESVTKIAREYASRFKEVIDSSSREEESMISQTAGGSPGSAVPEHVAPHTEIDLVNEPTGIVLDPMEGDFSYGFDLDTGPMDLDELDSAMNFTDLLE